MKVWGPTSYSVSGEFSFQANNGFLWYLYYQKQVSNERSTENATEIYKAELKSIQITSAYEPNLIREMQDDN